MVVHSFLLSIVGCYVTDGDVAPVSGVKKEWGRGGYGAHLNLVCCLYTSHVVVLGPLSVATSPFSMWPLLFE